MTRRSLFFAVALGTAGCAHSIDLFAPAAELAPNAEVVACITPGRVQNFDPAARVHRDGAVVVEGRIMTHVKPTDTLVVAAGAGDQVGRLRVQRTGLDAFLMITGAAFLIAGTAAAYGIACAATANDGDFQGSLCLDFGFLGSIGVLIIGLPILLAGLNGPLTVQRADHVSLDARGLKIFF